MITLGVDPGPVGHSHVFYHGPLGISISAMEPLLTIGMCDAAVIEWPVSIGIPIHRKPLDETMRKAAILADRLHTAGVAVYIPPRAVILRQLGYSTAQGNADQWIARYLTGIGYDMKLLRNTHLRAAMAAALFNWRDPRNAEYRYSPN